MSAFIVPRDAPGLSFGGKERKLGWNSQPTRAVLLDDCKIPAENLLSTEGKGFSIAMNGTSRLLLREATPSSMNPITLRVA